MKPNVYRTQARIDAVETVASNALTEAKRAHARLDVAPPRGEKGERGLKGDSIVGPAGRDGTNGRDGVGYPGVNGTNGRDGRDGAPGPDSAAVLAQARSEINTLRTSFTSLKHDFETLSLAFTTSSKKNAEYIEFLKARIAARSKTT
jgi:hypothetical protein